MKTLKRGIFNISDAAAAIAIGVTIFAIGLTIYTSVSGKTDSLGDNALINSVIIEAKNMRTTGGYGTHDLLPALISGGGLPKKFVRNDKLITQAGGEVTVKGQGHGVEITVSGLGKKDCMNLATTFGTADRQYTRINANNINEAVSAVAAHQACNDSANTLVFLTQS